jgi:hypothetical protein
MSITGQANREPWVSALVRPIKITAAMKRAGAEVIEGAPELYAEEQAERIYRAMAAAGKR